jgi:hypothetical protein
MARPLRYILLLILSLAPAAGAYPQQTSPPPLESRDASEALSYIFVSPNRRANLTLEEASRGLNAVEEIDLILATRDLSCRLGVKATVIKAIGNWSDGSEHSVLIKVVDDEASVRYAGAWLGWRFGQKGVIHFRTDRSGRASMYVLYAKRGRRNLAWLSRALERSGIRNRTIVPGRHRTAIYVIDLEGVLRRAVASAARRLQARLMVLSGTGGFVGHESESSKAEGAFAEVIGKYENEHPQVKRECQKERRAQRD